MKHAKKPNVLSFNTIQIQPVMVKFPSLEGLVIKKRLFLLPLIILFFSACFSPWQGDEGILTLQLGPGNSGRAAVLPEE